MSHHLQQSRRLAPLFVAAAICLLAQVSLGSHLLQRRHDTEWAEIEQQDDDDQDDGDAQSEGQSRAWGGQNQTVEGDSFPWFNILYRNPDTALPYPLDGKTTGYALEIRKNVFLADQGSIERATGKHGNRLVLRGWRALANATKKYVDPQKDNYWTHPISGTDRGVVRTLFRFWFNIHLYHIKREKYPYPPERRARVDITDIEPFTFHRYPMLATESSLAENCYVYAMAAPNLGAGTQFNPNANRTFVRWPVKKVKCEHVLCVFQFDESRAEGGKKGMGRLCNSWQDAGAPIMCSDRRVADSPQSEFYQRRYLELAYIVQAPKPLNLSSFCYDEISAVRLAEFVPIMMKEVFKLEKAGIM